MSVVKSKRGQSKVEFEQIYFHLADNIDNLVEHNFYAGETIVEKNAVFVEMRAKTLNCYLSWRGSESKNHNACYNTIHEMDMLFKALFPRKD